jgi:hypothetical protein
LFVEEATPNLQRPMPESDILPTQCYLCTNSFSRACRSVLTLCPCKVAVCQRCAISQMAQTDDFSLECKICGFKLDGDSGVIRNITKMKAAQDKYLERAWKFFGLDAVPEKSRALSKFIPLMQNFSSIGLSMYINKLQILQQDNKTNLSIAFVKLQLARIECLRDESPLDDPVFSVPQELPLFF